MEAIICEVKNGTFIRKTRKITSILKRSEEQLQDELPYNAITRQLADIIDCNACIVNSKGRLLGYFMRYKTKYRLV